MKNLIPLLLLSIFVLSLACNSPHKINETDIKKQIKIVLKDSETAWNEGDIEKYMNCYYQSDSLRFASGSDITFGWNVTLERYKKRYPNKTTMGILTFSDIDVNIISADAAIVFGRWHLQREKDEPSGLFTLLFSKFEVGWRIVHDHTSSNKDL